MVTTQPLHVKCTCIFHTTDNVPPTLSVTLNRQPSERPRLYIRYAFSKTTMVQPSRPTSNIHCRSTQTPQSTSLLPLYNITGIPHQLLFITVAQLITHIVHRVHQIRLGLQQVMQDVRRALWIRTRSRQYIGPQTRMSLRIMQKSPPALV
jgi:hypothetical protein